MLFFENYTITNVLVFILVLVMLLFINEITRRSKTLSIIFYIAVPILFTIFIWTNIDSSDTTSGNWFAWVKTYSALAGVIGFMALRYSKRLQKNKLMLLFPALILSINIMEAVFRDFEVFSKAGVIENGLLLQGGPWNIINGIAGILSVITLTGWVGIKVANNKSKDMVWADQLWFWVVAYGIWNMSYVYNCIPDRAFYAGVALVGVSTFAAFVGTKGVWLQHRAQTLALWAMFTLTFPNYANTEYFSIVSTHLDAPKLFLSILAIIANVGVLIYEIKTIKRTKRNPLKEELYVDTLAYKEILKANNL
ncbi:hypothetical protein CI105_07085 [Candidatus Izimaplasma bacterium ZiA1]|uniref:DUF5692 family protein n=1 Tax=Candidatus Izimoplasma sp. ZiA1 TaxID=2024899 RepID=UPI000BAA3BE3|nr:hypothetical protein CI105_07085 [Candidatus Izimaplasma bacterium ZiA1]